MRKVPSIALKYIQTSVFQRLVLATILLTVGTVILGFVANEVLDGNTQQVDQGILKFISSFANPVLDQIVLMLTLFGGVAFVFFVTCIATVYLYKTKRQRLALFTAFSLGGVLLTNSLLKLLFERERPALWESLVHESTYSFPSGHAALSCALALTAVIMMWRVRWRWVAVTVGALYILIIGFTRLYLAVHYPTDIIAGWLVASTWVLIVATICGIIRWRWPSLLRRT